MTVSVGYLSQEPPEYKSGLLTTIMEVLVRIHVAVGTDLEIPHAKGRRISCVKLILDWVFDWRLELLTALTYDSRLHLIIAPSLMSTLYRSLYTD
jgi:hypothetical protein